MGGQISVLSHPANSFFLFHLQHFHWFSWGFIKRAPSGCGYQLQLPSRRSVYLITKHPTMKLFQRLQSSTTYNQLKFDFKRFIACSKKVKSTEKQRAKCCSCFPTIKSHYLRYQIYVDSGQWLLIRLLVACIVVRILSLYSNRYPNTATPRTSLTAFDPLPTATLTVQNTLPHVTFAIKSSGRPDKVTRLVASIQKIYYTFTPTILIVDDSKAPLFLPYQYRAGVSILQLPYDSGLAIGRNELIRHTRTKYMMYFDDDFWLKDDSSVHLMVEYLITHPNVDIVGGIVSDRPNYVGFDFDLVKTKNDVVLYHKEVVDNSGDNHDSNDGSEKGQICKKVDIVPNFFTAKITALRSVRWDGSFKLGEHEDFFLRAKQKGLHVRSCMKQSKVYHAPNTAWYVVFLV
jgi:hypothetical protein